MKKLSPAQVEDGEHIINEDSRDDVDGHGGSDICVEEREDTEDAGHTPVIKIPRIKLPTLLFYFATLVYYVFNETGLPIRTSHISAAQSWEPPDLPMEEKGHCRCVNCSEDELCGGLWKANRFPTSKDLLDLHSKKIHIVVSHCNRNLRWVSDFTRGYEVASIHIISKCGERNTFDLPNATIKVLPNVGRCDHSYVYYIAKILDQKIVPGEEMNSIVVFLKDDMSEENLHQKGQWATFDSMVQIASSANGFACGIDATTADRYRPRQKRHVSFSVYHNSAALSQFQMKDYERGQARGYEDDGVEFASEYANLGDFYNTITDGERFFPAIAQVCYGGVFAASYQNIKRIDSSIWRRAQTALSRGDNIEEGHHMERCWGQLLATPLHQYQIKAIRKYSKSSYYEMYTNQTEPGLLFRGTPQ